MGNTIPDFIEASTLLVKLDFPLSNEGRASESGLQTDAVMIKAGPNHKEGGSSVSLVGKNIDAFCLRCQLTMAHIVLYEVGGQVRGVKCKTCGAEHRYHGPTPEKRRFAPAVRRNGGGAAAPRPKVVRPADARQWEARNAAITPDVVVWDYKLTECYEKGDVISHPFFGRGFAESITADGMEVLFREGRKQMAMNRPEAGS